MNNIEVMAPAGSFAALNAALQAGADAVYFGVGSLNMRAQAAMNFTENDLPTIVATCKESNAKAYLTVNTIVYDNELEAIKDLLVSAHKNKIDAIIASDLAVITMAREIGIEVHISTQCNITNIEAVRFFSKYADVMVTSREMSLEQLHSIVQKIEEYDIRGPKGDLVQIEVFAHGALCMAVSGKCYLSLDNYYRSANRGSCLQLCRRPYKLSEITDNDGAEPIEIEVDNQYLLSPKDLKTIDFLDRLLASGVRVLKIEGRGRTADYVKAVTSVYKEAVQCYQNGSYSPDKIEEWNIKLKHVYNRGFWGGYYMGKDIGEWSKQYGSSADRRKTYIGKVSNYFSKLGVAEIKIESEHLSVGDNIVVIGNTTGAYEDTIKEIRLDLKSVNSVEKGVFCSIPSSELLRRGDKLYRVDHI